MKRRDLTISMDGPGWVVVSEMGWNGWKAYRDGQSIPLRFANNAFLGFHLSEGEHEVTLVYWPRAFVNSALITFTMAALLLVWGSLEP